LFAVANNLQRHAAAAVPHEHNGPVRLLLRLFCSPRWLMGVACASIAVILQAAALARGGLIMVQAVIATGLVVALGIEAALDHRRPRPAQMVGAALVVLGVVLVVGIGRPGASHRDPSFTSTAIAWGAVLTAATVALARARRWPVGRLTAAVLGACAGVCFALEAGFLREIATSLPEIGPQDLRSPSLTLLAPAVALAGFGMAMLFGTLLTQRGYQTATLHDVMPAVAAAEPITAFAFGLLVLGEHMNDAPHAVAAVSIGFTMMLIGVVLSALARSDRSMRTQLRESRSLQGMRSRNRNGARRATSGSNSGTNHLGP
jgi:drug/metabolite transporter (DMT)-like permease